MSNSDIFMEDDIMTRADRSGIAITSEQDMIDLVLVMLGLQEPVPADLIPKPNLSFEQLYNIHLRKYIPIFWKKNIDFEKLFTSCKYKYGEHILYRFPGGKDCYRYPKQIPVSRFVSRRVWRRTSFAFSGTGLIWTLEHNGYIFCCKNPPNSFHTYNCYDKLDINMNTMDISLY